MDAALETRATPRLASGNLLPFLYGVDTAMQFYSLQGQAGRPVVLILAATLDDAAVLALVDAFGARIQDFAAHEADVVLAARGQPEALFQYAEARPGPVRLVACQAPEFFAQCGYEGPGPMVVVCNRRMRIAGLIAATNAHDMVAAALARVAMLAREAPRDAVMPAPALMIHDLIDRDFCRALIREFETGGSFDSGMAGGAGQNRIDYAKKKRRDHLLNPGDALYDEIYDVLMTRCAPEMKRVFQADITHTDRILIARYDVGDQFKRHVDNAAPQVAFRQFALSLNLNAGEYEGGYLTFPEFSPHRYAPPTGAGLIFSSSVLHEAAQVTRGQRYVLLTFLHDKHAERQRLGLA